MKYVTIVLIILSLMLTAFASQAIAASKIKCFVLQPPEQLLSGIQKVAVMDFAGQYGRAQTDQLLSALINGRRGITKIQGGLFQSDKEGVTYQSGARTDVYTLVERSRLDKVLSEQSLGADGIVDETQAAKFGKVLGVDAIIFGTVTPTINNVESSKEQERWNGKAWIKQWVKCVNRKVSVGVKMRIVDVNTGQILGTKESRYEQESEKCGDELAQLSTDAMVDECCRANASYVLANYFAPSFVYAEYKLEDIEIKEYEKLGEQAADAAEGGNIDKAFMLYSAILKEDAYNDAALYNIGVLHEVVGNYPEAQAAYEQAIGIRQNDDYAKALTNCKKMNAYAKDLEVLGVIVGKHSFEVSESQMASATAQKIKLKGDSGDRIVIRTTADDASTVLVKVPGGIEIEMLEKNGDWIKVKTFDGKIGFIKKDQLD